MRMILFGLALSPVFLLTLNVHANTESNKTLDFNQALQLALQHDLDLQSAEYAYTSNQSTRALSRASLLPQINATAFTQRTEEKTSNSSNPAIISNGTTEFDTDGYSITLHQSVYKHANYKLLEQASLNIQAASASLEAARQGLLVRLAEAYFNVLGAQDNLKFARAEKEAISKQLEQAQKRFEVGLIAVTDVKESQASYDLSVSQEINAQNLLSSSLEALAVILGSYHEKLSPLQNTITLNRPDPDDIQQWTDSARKNNLNYKAAQFAFQAAQQQVNADFAAHYPDLEFSAQRRYSDPEGGNFVASESTDTTLRLQLNVPIYSGGSSSAKHQQSVALKEQARTEMQKALRQAIQQTRDAFLGVSTSIAQVKALKQALNSTQIAYEAIQAGFEAGTRTAIDVLTSLREVYRAERDYARARYTYIVDLLRLKQAAGIITPEEAQRINQLLD